VACDALREAAETGMPLCTSCCEYVTTRRIDLHQQLKTAGTERARSRTTMGAKRGRTQAVASKRAARARSSRPSPSTSEHQITTTDFDTTEWGGAATATPQKLQQLRTVVTKCCQTCRKLGGSEEHLLRGRMPGMVLVAWTRGIDAGELHAKHGMNAML
jgi:hypothetical protein